MRAQCRGGLGVLHDGADLLVNQLADQRVAVEIDALVGPELGQDVDEIAGRPGFLEALAALGIAQLPAHRRLLRIRHARERPARLLAIGGAVSLEVGLAIVGRRTVMRGQRKTRRALEHGQMRSLLRDQRNRLDAR